jgi:hypothetical protein
LPIRPVHVMVFAPLTAVARTVATALPARLKVSGLRAGAVDA